MTTQRPLAPVVSAGSRQAEPLRAKVGFVAVMNRSRWLEVARIVVVAVLFAYAQRWVPIGVLWATVAVGLYPLAKTGLSDLVHEHNIGTEIFVTFATIFALIGGEADVDSEEFGGVVVAPSNARRCRYRPVA